jgi:23S rRNA (uracil1939-C5)-methyltransferase
MGTRSRRRRPPPQGEFTAEIGDLAQDGRGIARVDGKVVFVADALPGERVRYRLTRTGRDADEAQTVAVEQASPERVAPRCPHFGICGGCALQHLAPAAQLAFKQKQLLDALQRIGGVAPREIAAPVAGPVWGYRRRARLGVKRVPKKGGVLVGFRERETPLLAAIDRCVVLDARVGSRIRALATLIDGLSIAAQLPQIEVACDDDSAVLVLRVLAEPSAADRAALAEFAARENLRFWLQPGGLDSAGPLAAPAPATSAEIDAAAATTSAGSLPPSPLRYSPDGSALSLAFGPLDFVQVNGELAQAMVRQALDWLRPGPGDTVLELFAGLGNFTAPLAATGARVTAVEGEAALVRRGRENLQRNGLDAEFLRADLFAADPRAAWLQRRYDLALLDPPRSGAREVLPAVAATQPRRIVYVSCHPGTLARDAGELVGSHGYVLQRAGVLDMFPHTAHVESMALFERG